MNVLVLKEKHRNRYFVYNSREERDACALKIVRERLEDEKLGWYTIFASEKETARVKKIVETNNISDAWKFLCDRQDHEYEGFETGTAENSWSV